MSVHDMPGAAVSARLLAERNGSSGVLHDDELWEPPDDDPSGPALDRRASIVDRYTPIHWPDLWADTTDDGPDWLVPDVLERGRSHALVAAAKSGKSLLTLDLVCGLVTGRSLLGRPSPHERAVRVLYVDLENALADIRERLDAFGVGPDDLAALAYYSFPSLPALDSATGGQHLLALAEHHNAELVIIDTVARVVTGPENDADTFRALYRHALSPLKAQGRAVLRLDNTGKDTTAGARGSSAKADDVDTVWHLVDHGEGRIALRLDRQRSGHHPETVDLIRRTLDPEVALRHVRVEPLSDPRLAALLRHLDELGVPPDAGRPAARKALTDAGIKTGNDLLAKALETRRNQDRTVPDSSPTAELFEIIGGCPDGSGQEADTPSSELSRTAPGQHGQGEIVPEAGLSAPHLSPIRGQVGGQPGPVRVSSTTDALICPRCQYPTERFVPPDGLCPRCAYRGGGAPDDDIDDLKENE